MTNKWNENEENFENQGHQGKSQEDDFQDDGFYDPQNPQAAQDDWGYEPADGVRAPVAEDEDVEIEEIIEYVEAPAKPSLLSKLGFGKKKDVDPDAEPNDAVPAKGKAKKDRKQKDSTGKKKSVSAAASDILVEGHVISFGGKQTAANIFWDQFETGTSVKERAKEIDAITNSDSDEQYYSIYIDRSRFGQMGYSRKLQGHKAGIPALMTLMNPQMTGDHWIGIFQLEERGDIWWLASVHNGIVFDDKIIRGRINAEEAFNEGINAPGLTKFFAPASWMMDGTDHTLLHELIDFNLGAKLKHVHPVQANLAKIVLSTLLAAIAIGGLSWWKMEQDRKLAELEELERRIRENVAVGPEALPWYKLTRIDDFLKTCETEVVKSIVMAPGWKNQPISCSTNQGRASVAGGWNIEDGTFAWLRASVPAEFPQPVLTPTGKTASFSRSVDVAYDDMSHKDLPWIESKIESWLVERFQNHGVDISIRPSNDNRVEANMRPQFNSTDIRLTIRDNPQLYGDLLKDVPALVPVSLIYNVESNVWDLILKAHHPVIMPKPR